MLSLPINLGEATAHRSRQFRRSHHWIAAFVLGSAAWMHADRFIFLYWKQADGGWARALDGSSLGTLGVVVLLTYLLLAGITGLVARLSSWEAAYRGLRLPRPVVDRAMDYHAVHLLPPSLMGLAIIAGYAALEGHNTHLADQWVMTYLYTLAAAVVLSSIYLFLTYWTAMRNLMYANRTAT